MDQEKLKQVLGFYFSRFAIKADTETLKTSLRSNPDAELILRRLLGMSDASIGVTHFNQILHLVHEAGVSEGFFKYYFQEISPDHPYPVDRVLDVQPQFDEKGIATVDQLDWGLRRFFIDGLLYYGNIKSAFRDLRSQNYDTLRNLFALRRFDVGAMGKRSDPLPLNDIPVDDRYLIAEIACKAYSAPKEDAPVLIEQMLVDAFGKAGGGRIRISKLFDKDAPLAKEDPQGKLLLEFAADEFSNEEVSSVAEIRLHVTAIYKRFVKARELALRNTRLYLSLVNELDVYVATSMRKRENFRDMARDSKVIFESDTLKRLKLRYFDPTMIADEGHEDKGLIECLMVKCAKALLYFAGESDSFGKDAEVAMAMSLGKPVVILCPEDDRGKERLRIFKEIHPLSRLIEFKTGVACGAVITQDRHTAALLLERIFNNKMEYDLAHDGDGYFRLK